MSGRKRSETLGNFVERAKRLRYDIERSPDLDLNLKYDYVSSLGFVELGLTQARLVAEHEETQQLSFDDAPGAQSPAVTTADGFGDDGITGDELVRAAEELGIPAPEGAE